MPVIIDPAHYAAWLSPDTSGDDARALMTPWSPAEWQAYRVGLHINAVVNDDAECAAPLSGDTGAR